MEKETAMNRTRRKGFTLIELLVVIVILGILATLYITQVVPRGDRARFELTEVQMTSIVSALDSFNMDVGRYPDALEDLLVMPSYTNADKWQQGGYLKEMPKDGWGNKFIYRRLTGGTKKFELISYGANAQEGGEGHDRDIVK
jgi:general secretion pathway protein G